VKSHAWLSLVFLASSFAFPQDRATPPSSPAEPTYITHVTVIDTERGNELRDRTVVVSGGKITNIKDSKQISPGHGKLVNGTGKYLIPGLWDMHVHTWDAESTYRLQRNPVLLQAYESYSADKCQRLFAEMRREGVWADPTLTVARALAWQSDPQFANDSRLRYFTSAVFTAIGWKENQIPAGGTLRLLITRYNVNCSPKGRSWLVQCSVPAFHYWRAPTQATPTVFPVSVCMMNSPYSLSLD